MARPITYCSVDGCDVRCAANNLCDMHYRRWKKHGDPLAVSDYRTPQIPVEDRFWDKVEKSSDPDGCWEWTASKLPRGYGMIRSEGRNLRAHRVAYELLIGPVPEGKELDHLCSNPACVNPAHMEPVSHAENVRRGLSGRNMREKTHCPQGHPYDEENTYRYDGQRLCRKCLAAKARRRRARGKT